MAPPKPRGFARRLLRFAAWSMLVVVLLIGLLVGAMYWLMRTDSGREQVRRIALHFVEDIMPGLQVGAIEGDFINGLTFHRVVLRDRFGGEAIVCKRLSVRYDLRSLLIKRIHVHSAVVDQPRVLLRTTHLDSVNMAELVDPGDDDDAPQPEPTPEGPPRVGADLLGGWVLKVDALEILDGTYLQRLGDPATDLSASAISLATSGVWRGPVVTLQIDRLSTRARLPEERNVAVTLGGTGKLEGERLTAAVAVEADGLLPGEKVELKLEGDGGLERFAMDVDLRTEKGARIGVEGWAGLREGAIGPYEARVSVKQFDPSPLLRQLDPSRVQLQLQAKGYGIPPADDARAKAVLVVGPSTVQGWKVDHLKLSAGIKGPRWTVSRLHVAMAGTRAEVSGSGSLKTFEAKASLRAGDLSRIPLPRGLPKLAGSVELGGKVRGRFAGRISAEVNVQGRSVSVDDARVDTLDLTASLDGIGQLRPSGKLRLSAQGRAPGKLGNTLGATSVDLNADLGSKASLVRLKGTVKTKLGAAELHVEAPLTHRASQALPDLALDRPLKLKVASRGLDLGPMGRLMERTAQRLGGQVALDVQVGGTMRRPSVRARVQGSRLRFGQVKELDGTVVLEAGPSETSLRVEGKREGKQLLGMSLQAGLGTDELMGNKALGPRTLFGKPLQVDLEIRPTDIESLPRLHRLLGRMRGTVAGKVSVDGRIRDLNSKVDLKVTRAVFDHHELGDVQAQANLAAAQGKTRVDLKLEAAKLPLLRASGEVGAMPLDLASPARLSRAPITLSAQIPAIQLEKLPAIDDLIEDISGVLSATVEATGTAGAPKARALLELKKARFAPQSTDVNLKLEGSYDGKAALATLKGTQAEQAGRLEGSARIDLAGKQPRVDARVEARGFDVGSLAGVIPVVREARGKLDLVLTAKGPLDKPELGGNVDFSGEKLRLRGMSPLRNLELAAKLDSHRVRLDKLRVASGKGSLTASGHAVLRDLLPQSFELALRADKYQLGAGAVREGTFDGSVTIEGKRMARGMEAQVLVKDGVIRLPKLAGGGGLHDTGDLADVVFLDELDGEDPFGDRTRSKQQDSRSHSEMRSRRHSLALRADSLMVRGDEMDVEAFAKLKVVTDAQGNPRVSGEAGVRRGWIRVMDNQLVVRRARLQFSGKKDPDPSLDVRLTRRFPDVTVIIGLSGTASDPTLVLTSEPAIYDQSQLLALLMTGRVDARSDDKRGQSDQALALANAAMQVLVGGAFKAVGSQMGLDVARLKMGEYHDHETGESQTRAEAEIGKHVTRRIYVAYRRVFGADERENANEGLAEFRLSMRWMLMALFGDRGVGSLDVIWTYRY